MSPITIPIYFDYASTLCYIAWRIVRELSQELKFEPLWKGVPIRLREQSTRPGNALGAIERAKIGTVIAETGISVVAPERWLDSEAALMGSELAREANLFEQFHEAVFRAAFEQHRNIGNLDELTAIASAAGLDAARFRQDIVSGRMAGRLLEHRREADSFSALGYPTFMFGEFPLIGIQPKSTMRLLLERFLDQRRREAQA
jgi:predicted DsbA family dithiol-disulfide isomerase